MIRFMAVWVAVSMLFGVYRYLVPKDGKREIKSIALKVAISMVAGLVFIFVAMSINNLSGI